EHVPAPAIVLAPDGTLFAIDVGDGRPGGLGLSDGYHACLPAWSVFDASPSDSSVKTREPCGTRRHCAVVRQWCTMGNDPGNHLANDTRVERDALGEVRVEAARYWGAQTERAREHFPIGLQRFVWGSPLIRALGLVKRAAAVVNAELGA